MILCSQGICSPNYSLCPNSIYCTLDSYKCWDGNCVSDIKECNPLLKCELDKVICPFGGGCSIDLNHCPTLKSCEIGKILCGNGLCVDKLSECSQDNIIERCPKYLSHRCPNGDCVENALECNSNIVCPFDFPIYCNGECVPSPNFCKSNEKCELNLIECPNGDCVKYKSLCPKEGQCKEDYIKCWDGSCRYYNISNVPSIEDCINDLLYNNYLSKCECEYDLIYCDGECKRKKDCSNYNISELEDCYKEAEERAIGNCNNIVYNYPCDPIKSETVCVLKNLIKCGDGSCKKNKKLCGSKVNCPIYLHIFFLLLYKL